MRRLFGTIGLTYLSVLTVAFYLYCDAVLIALLALTSLSVIAGTGMAFFRRKYAWTVLLAGAAGFAAVAALFLFQNIYYLPLLDKYSEKEITFQGYVCDEIELTQNTLIIPLQTETVDGREECIKLYLTMYSDSEVSSFDCVEGRVTLQTNTNQNLISKGYYFTASQDKTSSLSATGQKKFSLYQYAVGARKEIRKALDDLLPRNSASLCKAILLGDKYALSKSARHDFARTGTTFLIVVSGMHLSILCGFIAFLLKLMRVKRLFRAAAVAAIVIGFVFLTGFSRSVIRAGIMTVIACGGMVIHRKSDSLNSMGVAALALSVFNPFVVGDLGVIMSFTATLGIVLWANHLFSFCVRLFRLQRLRPKWLQVPFRFVFSLISVSVSAALWMIPVAVIFFQKVTPLVTIVSVLTEPLTALILIFTLSALALYRVPCLTVVSKLAAFLLRFICEAHLSVNSFFASLPCASVPTTHAYFYIWLGISVLLVLICYLIRPKRAVKLCCVLLSASALTFGWAVDVLCEPHRTEVLIYQTYGGITVGVRRDDNLSLLSCGGKGGYNADLLDTLYTFGDQIDFAVIPNDVNCASFYPMIAEHFSVEQLFVNESCVDEIGVTDYSPIRNNRRFSLRLNSDTVLEVIDCDNIVYQYLRADEKTMLFVPHRGDIKKLPEEYRTADTILLNFVPDNADLLRCDELIYTGLRNKRLEKYRGVLENGCERFQVLSDKSLVIIL